VRFTFISTHCVQGIARASDEPDVTVFEDVQRGISVTLTSEVTPHLRLLNRHTALMTMMLRAMIGTPLPAEFSDRLSEETAKLDRQRRELAGNDPVIVIRIEGEIDAAIPSSAREILDFVLCFDAYDKSALRLGMQSQVSAVLTAIRMGSDTAYEFRTICDGSYLTDSDGRVVHSASFQGGTPGVYVSRRLTADHVTRMAEDIRLAISSGNLERVMRLHAHSLNKATDNYRSFIAAWSALEILIGKLFPMYQRILTSELRQVSSAPGLNAYLDRVASVMSDKHNLVDKFAVLSVYLDHENRAEEVERFRDLKRVRDRLSHGEELDEHTLPTKEVQRVFDKYLLNHLRRDA
jgi:hypothetical protein